ncbi:HRDC domain-containing protein [Demequina litorisediminis]|uniref:HRDC domain-containing protein n=1 Tax=Demequina litorisediminis TaxID=1849022 RepID=UPI003D67FF9C
MRDQRGLGVVRALWEERDKVAQQRDTSPGRVLRDAAIVAADRPSLRRLRRCSRCANGSPAAPSAPRPGGIP